MPHEIVRFFRLLGEELALAFQPAIDERRRKILWYPLIATLIAIAFKLYPLAGLAGLYCAYHITILAVVTAPVGIPLLWFASVSLDEAGRRWVRFASGILLGEIMFSVAATWLPLGDSWRGTFLAVLASLAFVVAGIHWGTESRLGRWAIKSFTAAALISAFALVLLPASAEATGERRGAWDKEVATSIKKEGFWATVLSWKTWFPPPPPPSDPPTGAKPAAGSTTTPAIPKIRLSCGSGYSAALHAPYANGARTFVVVIEEKECWTPVLTRPAGPKTYQGLRVSDDFSASPEGVTVEEILHFSDGTSEEVADSPTGWYNPKKLVTGRSFRVPAEAQKKVRIVINL